MRIMLFSIMFIGAICTTTAIWIFRDVLKDNRKDIHIMAGLGVLVLLSAFITTMSIWLLRKPEEEMKQICCDRKKQLP